MKRFLGRLVFLGAAAGAAAFALSYLRKEAGAGEDVVQVTFDDNTSAAFAANSADGYEFTDVARKLVEIGV